jgi:TM2 domain-containing membrane protein YozV
MDSQKVDMFIMANAKNFPSEKIPMLKQQMEKLDDSKFTMLLSMNLKDPTTLMIVSLFAGHLGIDRFMLGETGLGVAKLLTCGGLGIWTIVDWFTIMQRTRELNFTNLMMALSY